jgi:hypothetical protein
MSVRLSEHKKLRSTEVEGQSRWILVIIIISHFEMKQYSDFLKKVTGPGKVSWHKILGLQRVKKRKLATSGL